MALVRVPFYLINLWLPVTDSLIVHYSTSPAIFFFKKIELRAHARDSSSPFQLFIPSPPPQALMTYPPTHTEICHAPSVLQLDSHSAIFFLKKKQQAADSTSVFPADKLAP